ncbi:CRISPR-associated protein Cmr6 [Rhodobium orientis]|uniref:Type III-B CRISPR module RAMP protein Cmr6 n=1 Tax=Rhodobium orientis TaxID=34017 RepID=A0A327JIL8_9HYPH|nr:type III-B CRISPR module RAMP protein Cmr6 [Rhodobium orientis]MBB4302850.1 CRISPR-associated protein Cmr6 [Rhodobium orientis]RAI26247.1 type III-B CRISPR module RAMP protein Cmr6 [Rhodobium orientis]
MLPLPGNRKLPDLIGAQAANAGLVFYKFVDKWHEKEGKFGLHDEKKNWINRFVRDGTGLGRAEELAAHCERIERLARALTPDGADIKPVRMETVSRFVTGMGYEHGVENGFVFHHTLGVPFLPASGIKGLMRAFADHWQALGDGGEPDSRDWFERIVDLFGNYGPARKDDHDAKRGVTRDQRAPRMGRLIVFDALPVAPVKCACEVLTPHDGGWRAKGAEPMIDKGAPEVILSPGDWHNPIPIPFLVVEEGQTFLFALGRSRGGTLADLKEGYALLEAALEWIGAGAKTAVGFGQFVNVANAPLAENDRVVISQEHPAPKLRGRTATIATLFPAQGLAKVTLEGGGKGSNQVVKLDLLSRTDEPATDQ